MTGGVCIDGCPSIIGIWGEVDTRGVCVEEEASWVIGFDELAPVLWEEEIWLNGVNESVCGGEFDKTSLLDVYESDLLVFFLKEGRGNPNGETPSFSLWEQVTIRVGYKVEVILPSYAPDTTGFSVQIEISSNFLIKVWASSDLGL